MSNSIALVSNHDEIMKSSQKLHKRFPGSNVTQGNSLMMTRSFNKTFFKEDAEYGASTYIGYFAVPV